MSKFNKQSIDVSFAQGLDLKTDPKRVPSTNFLSLENTVFNKGGLLQKRNGYAQLTSLPDTTYSYLTTLNGNLTAIGKNIAAYSAGSASWVAKGNLQPLSLTTLPVIRNNLNQTSCDAAVGPNGLVCTVYQESNGSSTVNKYVIADSVTGQNITAPAAIPVTSGTVSGGMRVFVLGNNFVIVFTNTIAGVHNLQYVSVSCYDPSAVSTNTNIATGYAPATTLSWDAFVATNLYIAYNTTTGGQSVKVTSITPSFTLAAPVTFSGQVATMMSVTADTTGTSPQIYVSYYDATGSTGYVLSVDAQLNTIFTPQEIIASGTYLNITSAAQLGEVGIVGEVSNTDSNTGLVCHYLNAVEVSSTGSVGSPYVALRSVGLASKAFVINKTFYFLAAYQSDYQNSYFLVNASDGTAAAPVISAKLAYQNGGGYLTTGLPSVTTDGTNTLAIAYLYKDLISAVNKNTNVPTGNQVDGIYSQTGINLSTFTFGTQGMDTSEIGNDLHITGGFLWMYDGYYPVEHNFFLYPDVNQGTPTDMASWSTSGGSIHAQPDGSTNANAYFYQFTYEWSDNQGNAFRSAPSIPIAVTTSGSGTSGSITLNIPTLRLTMKTANPVKLVVYRWSVGQQNYYQTTSISTPLLNDTTVDSVQFVDTHADATILGNNLIYTTGGVVEDVNAPASSLLTLFDTRLWLVDAEDPNLLWFSKQVIEATPVEMSDLLTIYIPPTIATQGSTGPITAISVMDDKLIIFKENAVFYINGTGPDNTGANNQYSPPTFITSVVGCANQKSIIFMPDGLMFQSNKGIWLLNRSIAISYIGAPVESLTLGATVTSAVSVPETNQVRFTLSTGITLMYDYYYSQWGTFVNVPAVSSCIYDNLHTYINAQGATYQESVGEYLDGSDPTLIQFRTGQLRLGDLQNYQRAFFFYLLGTYYSPHKLVVNIYYDYADTSTQTTVLSPQNYTPPYGSQPGPYGQGTYGASASLAAPGNLEQFRVFLTQERCQSISISVQEVYDPSFGVPASAGLTLSGINIQIMMKGRMPTLPAALSFG